MRKSPPPSNGVKSSLVNAVSRFRSGPSVGSASATASLAGKEKELETLKTKVADLEEKNKELVEELAKAKEETAVEIVESSSESTIAELEAVTAKLAAADEELEELRARVANLEETV